MRTKRSHFVQITTGSSSVPSKPLFWTRSTLFQGIKESTLCGVTQVITRAGTQKKITLWFGLECVLQTLVEENLSPSNECDAKPCFRNTKSQVLPLLLSSKLGAVTVNGKKLHFQTDDESNWNRFKNTWDLNVCSHEQYFFQISPPTQIFK